MNPKHYPLDSSDREPFVSVIEAGKASASRVISRSELHVMAQRAGKLLIQAGLEPGDRFLLCMDANRLDDLAWRCAAAAIGTIPVTVNWQADSNERIRYKMQRTSVKAVVIAPGFATEERRPFLDGLEVLPLSLDGTATESDVPSSSVAEADAVASTDTRVIIFTSGTTGDPKPVALSYGAYEVNQSVFESFLGIRPGEVLTLVVTNPLHHANSTAVVDWALRRAGTRLILVERFSRAFWHALVTIVEETQGRVVVPAVSRHFDVLESMAERGELGVEETRLKRALARVTFLLGSAPVGPHTIAVFRRWTGRLPVVRFGSTELCLQALGTSPSRAEGQRLGAFQRGWEHRHKGEALAGFFIGRPHPPWTDARIVASVEPSEDDFMRPVAPGALGRIIVRSDSAFTGYWGDKASTEAAFHDGWYLGLGDHGFALPALEDGHDDFYWVGRDAGLMIRGGSNYSCQQVAAELSTLLQTEFGLSTSEFDLAVIGLKLESEHEDTCCVMLELMPEDHGAKDRVADEFMGIARQKASKGARPERLVLGALPRNFKGALDVRALSAMFES